jgi:diguanylate cyclase (GGDEF)-like protein
MKKNLKKITDATMQELLSSEIVLPSLYFSTFDQNAKKQSIQLDDERFEKEVEGVIVDEFKKIDLYMKRTMQNIDLLSSAADDAIDAIKNKDESKLSQVDELVKGMKEQIKKLQSQLYKDPLTKLNNRKWISYKLLNKEANFKESFSMSIIDIKGFGKINSKYGEIIGDSVLLYLSNFLLKRLEDEMVDFELSRYAGDKFLLFTKDQDEDELKTFLNNIRIELSNSILKSKSGQTLKILFCFGSVFVNKGDKFFKKLEVCDDLLKEDKFQLKNGKFIH